MKTEIKQIFIIVLFCFFSLTNNAQVVDENFEIFLCIGQSNMAGRAEITSQDTHVLNNAYLFNNEQKWEKAQNPMNRYSTIRKDLDVQHLGPSWTFAETLEAAGKHVGLVVNARGGTNIKEWQKGGTYYNEALSRALEAKKTGVLKGILWHQGESNQNSTSTYTDYFKTMIEDLRADLSIPNLPVIVGEIGKWRSSADKINVVISELKNHVPYLDYVSALSITHLGDDTHFNSESQRVLGRRYAAKYLELTGGYKNMQLPVLEDTYSNGHEPTAIEGNEITAIAKNHPDWERKALLKFDLSTISETITSAKLYINAKTTSGGDFDISVHEQADDSWEEQTTTHDNFTVTNGNIITTFTPSGTSYATPYTIDLTSFAIAQQEGDKMMSIMFRIPTENNKNDFRIVTKETTGGDYAAPYLDITYGTEESLEVKNVAAREFTMYPNPVTETLKIESESKIDRIDFYNINGAIVLTHTPIKSRKTVVNVSGLSNGFYLVKITNASGVFTVKKLIKGAY